MDAGRKICYGWGAGYHTIEAPMKAQPRTVKLVIAGASLLILAAIVFAQQAFNLKALLNLNPTDPSGIVISSALSALVFLVTLVFGFVLLWTVVKVWM